VNAPLRRFPTDLAPIEIDPRPCLLCGLTIDQHDMVDEGEGPLFFCAENPPDWLVAGIMQQWELADPRDKWRQTGETPPLPEVRSGPLQPAPPTAKRYRTPQSTIDAFWYVTRLDDPDYLARWLADHERDAAHLLKIWKARQC